MTQITGKIRTTKTNKQTLSAIKKAAKMHKEIIKATNEVIAPRKLTYLEENMLTGKMAEILDKYK